MENILAALIGAVGVVVAALLTTYGKNLRASVSRRKLGFPDIEGVWQAKWYVEKNGEQELYLEDKVYIEKVKGFEVFGKGQDPEKGTYPFRGKISFALVLTLLYEYEDPRSALAGVMVLKVHPQGRKCSGRWYGLTKEEDILGGSVTWERVE